MRRRMVVDLLLPGGPCEDFCYRFKTLGSLDRVFETEREFRDWCNAALAGNPRVTHAFDVREDGVVMWRHARGATAWYPRANLCLRLVPCKGAAERPLLSTTQLTGMLTAC